MSLILCPECGARISDRATCCPHCGFQSEDALLPISAQDRFEPAPRFTYEIEKAQPLDRELCAISYEDNRNLARFFGSWDNIRLKLPALAEVISSMAQKETVLVAKMDDYVRDLIDRGVYRFTRDASGEILPTIRDGQHIVKQVRLEKISLTPSLVNSLNNLSLHAAMAQILDEIEHIGDQIRALHVELQNDRLAMVESARDRLQQARRIQDTRLRERDVLSAIGSATDAKRVLMRNFAQNLSVIHAHAKKSDLELLLSPKGDRDVNQAAIDAMQALVYIAGAVRTECEGYALLGEYEAGKECLQQFRTFIAQNRLDCRDTLLLLNEHASQKRIDIVDGFSSVTKRIAQLESAGAALPSGAPQLAIPEGAGDEGSDSDVEK